jgi:hypothetical protein
MPNVTPPARYDLPWKAALTHAFRAFMGFFFPDLCAQIDWGRRPHFRDKELAGIGINDTKQGLVADELVEVYLRNGRLQCVLIHIEIQAQRDAKFALRVGISFAIAKLLDYANRSPALLASHNPFALITLAHLRTQQDRHDPDKLYAAKWQVTKLLYQHGWSKGRIIMLFKVINWMMALPRSHEQQYWRAVFQLERRRKMEWISPLEQSFIDKGWEKGLKKGRQEGRQEGLEQGRMEGAAALLEHQLTRRFGPLPQTARNKLAKASVAQLGAWSDALPEAQSLKQVFGQKRPSPQD